MSENNIFKHFQTTFFSKASIPIVVKFQMKHDQTSEFQNYKIGSGQESMMAAVTKNSKNNKINFFFRTIRFFWLQICLEHKWNLGIQNCKNKQKTTSELGQSNQLSVYKSNFAQMPISQENMNLFWSDSITMVPEWNLFIFMQIDNP